MHQMTTIQLDKSVLERLKKFKKHPRQSYNEIIVNMLEAYRHQKSQYDEFLHKIQQPKMKELWDNEEDEAWEKA